MATKEEPMITLVSGDGKEILLPLSAARPCHLVSTALSLDDDDEEDEDDRVVRGPDYYAAHPVHVQRVGAKTLERIVEYLIHYEEELMTPIPDPLEGGPENMMTEVVLPTFEENVPQVWYREFMEDIGKDLYDFYNLRSASNFMDIKPLIYLANIWLVFQMKGKTVDEIRQLLFLPEMTNEEDQEFRRDHPWLYQLEEQEAAEQN